MIRIGYSLIVVGSTLLGLGIFLAIVGAEILNISFIRMDLVPWGFGLIGSLLLILGLATILTEKHKTKEDIIEENDERLITINERSKSKAYDLMVVIIPLTLLGLAMFGYMNVVSFFLLATVYFVCYGYFVFHLLRNKAKM